MRTFLAKDMKEALATMRAELGEDAIMVSSERLKDGSLCLRAGVEQAQRPEVVATGAGRGYRFKRVAESAAFNGSDPQQRTNLGWLHALAAFTGLREGTAAG